MLGINACAENKIKDPLLHPKNGRKNLALWISCSIIFLFIFVHFAAFISALIHIVNVKMKVNIFLSFFTHKFYA